MFIRFIIHSYMIKIPISEEYKKAIHDKNTLVYHRQRIAYLWILVTFEANECINIRSMVFLANLHVFSHSSLWFLTKIRNRTSKAGRRENDQIPCLSRTRSWSLIKRLVLRFPMRSTNESLGEVNLVFVHVRERSYVSASVIMLGAYLSACIYFPR